MDQVYDFITFYSVMYSPLTFIRQGLFKFVIFDDQVFCWGDKYGVDTAVPESVIFNTDIPVIADFWKSLFAMSHNADDSCNTEVMVDGKVSDIDQFVVAYD